MFKQKSDPSAANARLEPADAVRLARVKARQRLIGAIVLLGIGILGFPLVFETQPRPIPVDIPIEIPRREAMPPLAMPPARAPVATGRSPLDRLRPRRRPARTGCIGERDECGAHGAHPQRGERVRHQRIECRRGSRAAGTEARSVEPSRRCQAAVSDGALAVASPSTCPRAVDIDIDIDRRATAIAREPCSKAVRRAATDARPLRRPGRRLRRCRRGARDAEARREAGPEDLHAGREDAVWQPHPRARRPVRRARRGGIGTRQGQGSRAQRRAAHAVTRRRGLACSSAGSTSA